MDPQVAHGPMFTNTLQFCSTGLPTNPVDLAANASASLSTTIGPVVGVQVAEFAYSGNVWSLLPDSIVGPCTTFRITSSEGSALIRLLPGYYPNAASFIAMVNAVIQPHCSFLEVGIVPTYSVLSPLPQELYMHLRMTNSDTNADVMIEFDEMFTNCQRTTYIPTYRSLGLGSNWDNSAIVIQPETTWYSPLPVRLQPLIMRAVSQSLAPFTAYTASSAVPSPNADWNQNGARPAEFFSTPMAWTIAPAYNAQPISDHATPKGSLSQNGNVGQLHMLLPGSDVYLQSVDMRFIDEDDCPIYFGPRAFQIMPNTPSWTVKLNFFCKVKK